MHKPMTKNSLNQSTIAYCRRNNINEKQLIKAMNWYKSAKQIVKKQTSDNSFLKN